MSFDFETTTYGKWILSGEHAVLRNHPAIVFPLKTCAFKLSFQKTTDSLKITQSGMTYPHMDKLIRKVISQGLAALKLDNQTLTGRLHLSNEIPLGVGLGASAALCVAITRWLQWMYNENIDCFQFARQLEHLFHGQSSGLDIAGTAAHTGVYFQNATITPISYTWQPHWYLSTSKEVGDTAQCIQRVQSLWENNPQLAQEIDQQMRKSVDIALLALEQASLENLVEAFNLAESCFEKWGLITPVLNHHLTTLKKAGAIAAKPTGSGGGGHILSLWPEPPPKDIIDTLELLHNL